MKLQNQATTALRPAYEELAARLPAEPVLGIDETPSKESHAKCWLWTFVAKRYSVFRIRPTRKATILADLLGESFTDVVNCDRAKMYWSLPRLQWCWAHLKRDVQSLIDSPDRQVRRLGHDLMRPTRELFRQWSRCRDGTITRRGFVCSMKPIRREVDALLLRGVWSGNPRLIGMCRELHYHRQWLWTFIDVEGVEPTNNVSERALRHPVIWRKLPFGTQSAAGSRFVETCRQQSHNVLEFLTTTMEAHFQNQPAPSLLPRA